MTFTTYKGLNQPIDLLDSVAAASQTYKRLSTDDKLGLLWFLYVRMGNLITPAATGAARLQFAQGLLDQVQAMAEPDQLQFMRDLVNKVDNPLSRAYGVLTNNTKLAFWYELAQLMRAGKVIAVPSDYKLSSSAQAAFDQIAGLNFNQQITVLRQAAVDMGLDPFAR